MIGLVTEERHADLTDDDRPLIAALAARGLDARPVRWDDPAEPWRSCRTLVLRSCWDYHLRPAEFARWLDAVDRAGVPLWNPVPLVKWNMHKAYLRDLERGGVSIPRTVWIDRGTDERLRDVMRRAGWAEAVVKPAVSASATHTWRVHLDAADEVPFADLVRRSDVLVQELIPEVAAHGEWSVVLIAGAVSHAMIKRPKPGDFRVQTEHGGSAEPAIAPVPVRDAAATVATRIPWPWLYARVDGVQTKRGFVLMELECIEPHLFFSHRPAARTELAEALRRRLATV